MPAFGTACTKYFAPIEASLLRMIGSHRFHVSSQGGVSHRILAIASSIKKRDRLRLEDSGRKGFLEICRVRSMLTGG